MKNQSQIEQEFIARMNFDQYLEYCDYLVKKIEDQLN